MRTIVNNAMKVLSSSQKRTLLQLIVLDFIISVLDISFLVGLLYVMNYYTGDKKDGFAAQIFSRYPLMPISLFFILFSLKNYAAYIVFKRQFNFVYHVASQLSKEKLIQYLRGSFFDFTDIDSSVHIHRINQQPIEFSHYVLKGILQVCSQALLLLITLVAVLLYKPEVFLLLFALLVPPVLLTGYILKMKLHSARTNAKSASQKSLQHLHEALSSFVESKIHNKESFFTKRYLAQQERLNKYLSEQQIIQNVPSRLIEVFAILGLFLLIIVNRLSTDSATLPIMTIGAFVAACYKIIPGIGKIMNHIGQVKTYAYTCDDLLPVKTNDADQVSSSNGNIHSFQLSNISFHYKKAEVLNNFSMKARRGDFLGMCGASGKGKSTMLNVLLGFIAPASGHISINDIDKMQSQLCWKNISYVKQQPFLINDTIRTNITLHENLVDHKKLAEVMEVTGVDQIVAGTPEGLNTIISEQGRNLSGGQRQRIALARALYKDFDLLVLDEPFSELDEDSEKCIMNYLRQVAFNGKIVVLITHNKNALAFCNKTVSMDDYN